MISDSENFHLLITISCSDSGVIFITFDNDFNSLLITFYVDNDLIFLIMIFSAQ